MAQINLLSSNTEKANIGQGLLKLIVKVLVAVLVLVALYYVWLLWSSSRATSDISTLQNSISQSESEILGQKDRQELIVRQGQLQALSGLIANHVYWSNIFPKLAEATLKSAAYLSLSFNDDGTGSMTVSVPSYTELDKFLQVFDLPQVSDNFSDIKIAAITKTQKGDTLQTKAELRFKYSNKLISKKLNP